MTDPVREEMQALIKAREAGSEYIPDSRCTPETIEARRNGRDTFITDLLHVIRGRTWSGEVRSGPKTKRRICDKELTHTLESLPEEVKSD